MTKKDLSVGMACGLAVGMTVGLVAGVVAGVLLAPASGAETRRKLRYQRDHAVDAARSRVRRTMTRLHLAKPQTEEEEEDYAFSGA